MIFNLEIMVALFTSGSFLVKTLELESLEHVGRNG